jgi:hypothetical protein
MPLFLLQFTRFIRAGDVWRKKRPSFAAGHLAVKLGPSIPADVLLLLLA